MRLIAASRGLELGLRNPTVIGYDNVGSPILSGTYLKAEFMSGGISEYEAAYAIPRLTFKGMYDGENPLERLSWFDTEYAQKQYGWSDEDRLFAEERLLNHPDLGRIFLLLEEPKVELPWASYDDLDDPERIVELMNATGTTKAAVLNYERQNKNRIEVIDAVEADDVEEPADAPVVVKA